MGIGSQLIVEGLTAPAEIRIDEYGIAHLRAQSEPDLFLAQGFNAARDRLFQIDLWRRQGLGRLAAVFGDEFLERDAAARLLLYRGDLRLEWLAYADSTRRVCTSFVAGINAYIRMALEDPELLPPEFGAIGYLPEVWDPADIVRIRNTGVYTNAIDEVVRAMTVARYGAAADDLRQRRIPADPLSPPEGLDLAAVSFEDLGPYLAAMLPPAFAPHQEGLPTEAPDGSNNWAVHGSRTATGRPILASDPHRDAASLPGLRYLVHLSCPGLDVIGGGEPHLPGISVGHNGHAAFGYTIFFADQEDLYVYELDPEDPERYRYGDGWEAFRLVQEEIPTRTGDQPVTLRFTRHGPVLRHDPASRRATALRAAWLEPGMAPYLGSLGYMRARSWQAFLDGLNGWGGPGEYLMYADADGRLGWRAAGLVPHRPNWDGTFPVPGDGRYEWDGWCAPEELPGEVDPERGFTSTANQYPFAPEDPLAGRVGRVWPSGIRKHRIDAVLAQRSAVTVAEMFALQDDVVDVLAPRVIAAAAAIADAHPLLTELRGWDGRLEADSHQALVYELWVREHLTPALRRHAIAALLPPASRGDFEAYLATVPPPKRDDELLAALLETGADHLAAIVTDSLERTRQDLLTRFGLRDATAVWGDLHRARADHPLRRLLPGLEDELLTTGDRPTGGSPNTLRLSMSDAAYRKMVGATFRVVVDVGGWDGSLAMNSPGQSGDPRSRHYRDLVTRWIDGDPLPLRYTRAAVDASTVGLIRLLPAG